MEIDTHGFVVWIKCDALAPDTRLRGTVEDTATSIRTDFETGDELLSSMRSAIRRAASADMSRNTEPRNSQSRPDRDTGTQEVRK